VSPSPSATQVYLIEVNTSPALFRSGSVLSDLLPRVIEELVQKVLDPLFPPPPDQAVPRARPSTGDDVQGEDDASVHPIRPLDGFQLVDLGQGGTRGLRKTSSLAPHRGSDG